MLRIRIGALLVGVVVLGFPTLSGAAEPRTTDIVSTSATAGNGPAAANYRGSSADGTRVFFQTSEQLVPADTDNSMDVYERANGVTTLISIGSTGGNGAFNAVFNAVSDDGTKVFFRTPERLESTDTDSSQDIYMRQNGVTTLMSIGPTGGNGNSSVVFDGISADGSHLFFDTLESLVSSDTDSSLDIYDRSGGTTTLISTGSTGGNGMYDATFDGASRDGSRVFFTTDEKLVSSDTDISFDVYQRFAGTTTQLSIGPAGGNGDPNFEYDSFYDGASADGTKVWFHTNETLTVDDTDATTDVYQWSAGTTTLISTGSGGGNAAIPAFFAGSSDDGSHVFFDTAESLDAADTDSSIDIYDRSAGTTTLVSTGPAGGNGAFAAAYQANSADGSRVFFHTSESLVAADTDGQQDVYERAGGQTTLISTSATDPQAGWPASYSGSSRDGSRVYFNTVDALDPGDTDIAGDIYQRYAGDTTWISTGPVGGNGGQFVSFAATSQDGSRVFFQTDEPLVATDTDTSQDVYTSGPARFYPRPKGATPLRASLVPAFQACTIPNSSHGAPLAYSSCAPPAQASGFLTVGAPDSNGVPANSIGFAKFTAVAGNASTPANEADMKIDVSMTDVRRKADLADYTGELQLLPGFRVTDRLNGSPTVDQATVSDFGFAVTVPCNATAATNTGSVCAVTTTANSVLPGSIVEVKRTIVEMGQIRLFDGGSDGLASTAGNSLFAIQGVFTP
jgi:hypothetical protein